MLRKVVHLTSVHLPYDTRIYHRECQALAEDGYEVVLVAPSEQPQAEGSRLVQLKTILPARNRLARMTSTVWRAYKAALSENAHIYHFHDPELILVALLLKLRGKRVIYDVHEDYGKVILSKEWLFPWARRAVAQVTMQLECLAARALDGVVAATPAIARRFPTHRTVIVQNFPFLGELDTPEVLPYNQRPPWVVYVGGLTAVRGVREMVKAIALLPERLGARLVLAGRFTPPGLEAETRSLPGWERVEFVGWQARVQVARLLGKARMGLLTVYPEPNHLEGQPLKLFEYMAAGLPVVTSTSLPRCRELVERVRCGLLVDPFRPQAIAEAMWWVLEHPEEAEAMGTRGRQAVLDRYNWSSEGERLLQLYRRLNT